MAGSSIPSASPRHPLLSSFPLNHPCGLGDALGSCVATLTLLAEFFSIKNSEESEGFDQKISRGIWLQLTSVIGVLEIAARIAKVDAEKAYCEEITLPFNEIEYQKVETAAKNCNQTVENYLSVLVREFVERFGEGVAK